MEQRLTRTVLDLAGIPCLEIRPQAAGPLPTVLLYHGWTSNKENQRFLGGILASQGFAVIAPDAPGHGGRDRIDFSAPTALPDNFWRTVLSEVREAAELLSAVLDRAGTDPDRLGVVGISMGGYIGSGVFARHREIKCFVNLLGTGAWEKSEELRQAKGRSLARPDQMADIMACSPLQNKDSLYPRPLLMLHGDADPIVPVECERYFASELASVYRDEPGKVKLVETPGLEHFIELDMVEAACAWLREQL